MTGDPALLYGCAVALLLVGAPAYAVLAGGPARTALLSGPAVIVTALVWLVLGWDASVAVFQGAVAGMAVSALVPILRRSRGRVAASLVAAALALAVHLPLALALFDVRSGLLSGLGALDFGGAVVLGLAPGVLGGFLATGGRTDRPIGVLAMCGVLIGLTAALLGSELVIDDALGRLPLTLVIAAATGALGWVLAHVLLAHAFAPGKATAGAVAGSLTALAAPLWLDPVAAGVLGLAAGLLGRAVAGRPGRALVGLLAVPAGVGLVGSGIAATGRGLLASGQTGLVVGQLAALAAGVVLAGAAGGVLLLAEAIRRGRGPDGRRRGTAGDARPRP